MTTLLAVVAHRALSVTALLALTRLYRGPSLLDRVIAADVLLATMVGAVGRRGGGQPARHHPARARGASLLGFVGAVAAGPLRRPGAAVSAGAVADWLGAVCLVAGALLSLAAGIGVLRFPDALSRMHAATKPQVLGVLLMLLGIALRLRHRRRTSA